MSFMELAKSRLASRSFEARHETTREHCARELTLSQFSRAPALFRVHLNPQVQQGTAQLSILVKKHVHSMLPPSPQLT